MFSLSKPFKLSNEHVIKVRCNFLTEEIKIAASYVTKKYEMKKKKSSTPEQEQRGFWALRGITFQVYAGEAIGLIGTNGSGKSTLSNIIAGASKPTTGEIVINGKTSIISINTGLKSELTGRENVKLKCLLSGMTHKEIDAVIDDIIEFAELDDFIDQPLKNYSSGMKSRLGFAISVHNDPDIMIIDEALSVGDDTFYQRCVDKMMEFKASGKTIFFVSHSKTQIRRLCDKVMWIHEGELKQFGPTEEVIEAYRAYIKWYKKMPKIERRDYKKALKAERRNFDFEGYYEAVVAEQPGIDQEALHQMFYPIRVTTKMRMGSKLMIIVVVVLLCVIGLFYMTQLAQP
ncbi:MAG: ABC transporter ATP-binding protein [Defluviitaleaceae bacterium]|nr:ABC transporter ATP-binding protein [Defluviitaleaceae bacterium]